MVHISNGRGSLGDPHHADFVTRLPRCFRAAPWIEEEPRADQEAPAAVDPVAAFRSAREHLVRQGVAPHQAEDNLRLLLEAMANEYRARQAGTQAGTGA